MIPRSLLFAPADHPAKMAKACASDADAVILDLEDSVATANKPKARELAAAILKHHPHPRRQSLWVRINPVASGLAVADLVAVVPSAPDGIMLPKPDSVDDVMSVAHYLEALETANDLPPGGIKILPIATETAKAVFALSTYANAGPRLVGLTWGAEDLAASLGAASARMEGGALGAPFALARSLCLMGAAAAEVPAIETVYPDFRDLEGLAAYAAHGRRDGFVGMMAIHPTQVPVINRAFTPAESDVEEARRIVAAFEANPGAGTIGIEGKMYDAPHLRQAKRILDRAQALQTDTVG